MMLRQLLAVLLALGCVVTPALADDGQLPDATANGGMFQERQRPTPAYRPYFYNYPHAIPADYVFRTARVFSPQNMSSSILPGFGSGQTGGSAGNAGQGAVLQAKINQLGKALIANASEVVADEYVVAVSTFVSLDNLYATSSLGRFLGEQLLSTLQQAGLEVIEVRKTPGMMVSPYHGEYALSRSMDEISLVQEAQAVVVGTYAVAGQEIFVNVRLLRNADNRVLSSASMVLPIDGMTANLLANESMPASTRTAQVGIRQFPEEGQVVPPPPVKKATKKSAAKRPVKRPVKKDCP
ncbi:MAG: FlgO family outer membrane protein [Deltaproteobacteria bacterium]|nr:FlgO family outer membrane protein [Deltaproteobacteria bacterium]